MMEGDLYLEAHGSGPGLLVLGGWGLTTGPHVAGIDPAWTEGRRLLLFDYPGLGRSPAWAAGFTTYDLAQGLLAALQQRGETVERVVGQGGLGAGVAMHLAAGLGDSVRRLVLSAGWAGPEPYHDAQLRTLRTARELSWEAFEELANVYCVTPELFDPQRMHHRVWHAPGSVRERRDAHLALIGANLTHDARAVLPQVRCPALVIAGEKDLLGGPRLGREVAELLPAARYVEFAGHPHSRALKPGALEEYRSCVAAFLSDDEGEGHV